MFDLESGDDIAENVGNRIDKPLAIAWSSKDGEARLAIAGVDKSVCIFDPTQKKFSQQMTLHGWKTGLAWSPDGERLAVSARRSITIWNVDQQKIIGTCEGPSAMIRDISWSSSQNRIAALAEDGLVCLWNAETFAYCARFANHQRAPFTIRWSPDGKQLASTARHGRLVIQSPESGDEREIAEP